MPRKENTKLMNFTSFGNLSKQDRTSAFNIAKAVIDITLKDDQLIKKGLERIKFDILVQETPVLEFHQHGTIPKQRPLEEPYLSLARFLNDNTMNYLVGI